ncbi:DCR2 [Candida pseudojiufengensis]|uniref:DCR2 n=1 Tax=Candida pseudojiufengensis TaxID=497109 RepID=UPI0022246C73|nr:DCR2 [Candida pseudojiufengensis]KAI5964690.1 DCR2 [Candida pseudojiufengensis]
MLPRRIFRVVLYAIAFLSLAYILLLFANKHQIIEINKFIPYGIFSSTAPSFFQPPSDSFILDISINQCYFYNYNNPNCGKPEPSQGNFGDISPYEGGWVRLKKDLCLGKCWTHKEFFAVKKINHDKYQKLIEDENLKDEVIVDIAIANSEIDSSIKGNEKLKLPRYIIETYHNSQQFDDSVHANLVDQNKNDKINVNDKRLKVTDRDNLDRMLYVPTINELEKIGWTYKSHGIWVKYGEHDSKTAINAIDFLFGPEAVEPRPNWNLIKNPIKDISSPFGLNAFITYRRGPKLDYKKEYGTALKMNANDEFKILQVADLHFSTDYGKCLNPEPPKSAINCKADSRTLKFINKVLDIEKPDLVVLTGDQIFGQTSPDSETAAFKALAPFIERKIPFAIVLGNHDAEGSLDAQELMGLYTDLPHSVSAVGPVDIDGFGNYMVTVEGKTSSSVALSFYFVDSHAYSPNQKVHPGYDWIKENQLMYMREEAASIQDDIKAFEKETFTDPDTGMSRTKTHLAMAFFHIPIPEFKNVNKQTFVGEHREGVTSPGYNSGARDVFQEIGVKAISIGHDHCNDYCLLDENHTTNDDENKIWLCYGGGVGLGGYGGYGGYIRRLRIFNLNTAKGEIKTWKRTEDAPDQKIDEQVIVTSGKLVNW